MADDPKKAVLELAGNKVEMPVKSGTIGPDVVDITKLYAQTGAFTFDPGFTSTASCESKITYIDGDEGVLLYRGYPIEQLAEHGSAAAATLPQRARTAKATQSQGQQQAVYQQPQTAQGVQVSTRKQWRRQLLRPPPPVAARAKPPPTPRIRRT